MKSILTKNKAGCMIIGKDFNEKSKKVLKLLAKLSGSDVNKRVEVHLIAKDLKFDRIYIKNVLEYLENKECLLIDSLGGPYLYGHVKITKKGLLQAGNMDVN